MLKNTGGESDSHAKTKFYEELNDRLYKWRYNNSAGYFYLGSSTLWKPKTIISLDNCDFQRINFDAKVITTYQSEGGYETRYYGLYVLGGHVSLKGANFSFAALERSIFRKVNLRGAQFEEAVAKYSQWYKPELSEANLAKADFSLSSFSKATMSYVQAEQVNFTQAFLNGLNAHAANFKNGKFDQARLKDAKLSGANFEGASLEKAFLKHADLTKANLRNTNLKGADFSYADLSGTDLEGADLTSAKLHHANLNGANLQGVIGITLEKSVSYGIEVPQFGDDEQQKLQNLALENISLSSICQRIKNGAIKSFLHFTEAELKILWTNGKRDKQLGDFVQANAVAIKESCRQRVYAKYLERFTGVPFDISLYLVKSNKVVPEVPFINKKAIKNYKKSDFFKKDQQRASNLSLVLIKSEGLVFCGEIFAELERNKISISAIKMLKIPKAKAEELYKYEYRQYYFDGLIKYITGGTVIALAVKGNPEVIFDIKMRLRKTFKQRPNAEHLSLLQKTLFKNEQAISGTDREKYEQQYLSTFNVLHCSDPGKGESEVKIFFDNTLLSAKKLSLERKAEIILKKLPKNYTISKASSANNMNTLNKTQPEVEKNCLMIVKPEGLTYLPLILSEIYANESIMLAAKTQQLSKKMLQKLYQKYVHNYFYDALIDYIAETKLVLFAVNFKGNVLKSIRNKLRELTMPQTQRNAAECWKEHVKKKKLQDKYKISENEFITEFCRTFDILHTSDDNDGEYEIGLFFSKEEFGLQFIPENEKVQVILDILNAMNLAHGDNQAYSTFSANRLKK